MKFTLGFLLGMWFAVLVVMLVPQVQDLVIARRVTAEFRDIWDRVQQENAAARMSQPASQPAWGETAEERRLRREALAWRTN